MKPETEIQMELHECIRKLILDITSTDTNRIDLLEDVLEVLNSIDKSSLVGVDMLRTITIVKIHSLVVKNTAGTGQRRLVRHNNTVARAEK